MATHKISDNELIETLAFIGVMWVFYHADKEGLNLTFNEIVERVFPSLAGDENERLAIVNSSQGRNPTSSIQQTLLGI